MQILTTFFCVFELFSKAPEMLLAIGTHTGWANYYNPKVALANSDPVIIVQAAKELGFSFIPQHFTHSS